MRQLMPPLWWHLQTAFSVTNYLTIDHWPICKNHQTKKVKSPSQLESVWPSKQLIHFFRMQKLCQISRCAYWWKSFLEILYRSHRFKNKRVLKGGGGGGGGYQSHFPAHFFRNPNSQGSNPIPTSRIWKKSQCYTCHLFSLRISKITASKYDPIKTQKFTRIYKGVLKITRSFQTVIKLLSSEFIAISPCHFTFLPFLPAGLFVNIPLQWSRCKTLREQNLQIPFVYWIHLCHTFFVYFSPSELLKNPTVNSICSFLCV